MLSSLKEQFRRMQEASDAGRKNADQHNMEETEPEPADATEDYDQLPENWERHWDDENGLHFYWNAVINESCWERPD